MEYLWPQDSWRFPLNGFVEGTRTVKYAQVPGSLEILH
jgi:hypothetical protein